MKITKSVFTKIRKELDKSSRKEIRYNHGISHVTMHYIANSPTYKDYKHFIDLTRLVPSKRNLT